MTSFRLCCSGSPQLQQPTPPRRSQWSTAASFAAGLALCSIASGTVDELAVQYEVGRRRSSTVPIGPRLRCDCNSPPAAVVDLEYEPGKPCPHRGTNNCVGLLRVHAAGHPSQSSPAAARETVGTLGNHRLGVNCPTATAFQNKHEGTPLLPGSSSDCDGQEIFMSITE